MSLPTRVVHGNRHLRLTPNEAALTEALPAPPYGLRQLTVPFQGFLRDANGSADLRVTTETEFFIESHPTRDRYITDLSFTIQDGNATLADFGALAPLTNGCLLFYRHITEGQIDLAPEPLKSNWDFVRLGKGTPAFGDDATVFRAKDVEERTEAYIPFVSLRDQIPPYGLKLDAGSTNRLVLTVRDDTSGVDGFDCVAYGFDRLPDEEIG